MLIECNNFDICEIYQIILLSIFTILKPINLLKLFKLFSNELHSLKK